MAISRAAFLLLIILFSASCSTSQPGDPPSGWSLSTEAKPAPSNTPFKYVAEFSGKCTRAIFAGGDRLSQCYGHAVNIVLKDGRSEFGFYLGGQTTLVFSGGKDAQPETNRYIMQVDSLRLLSKAESQGTMPAEGFCVVGGEIVKAAIIDCVADAGGKLFDFELKAERPAKWRN